MQTNNTLAEFLIKKKIVADVRQANVMSFTIFATIIVICIVLISRNLFSTEPIAPQYYYDPTLDIDNT